MPSEQIWSELDGNLSLFRGFKGPDSKSSLLRVIDDGTSPVRADPLVYVRDTEEDAAAPSLRLTGKSAATATTGGGVAHLAEVWEDYGGAAAHRFLTFDANLAGTGWPSALRKSSHGAGEVPVQMPKALVLGATGKTTYLRVVGRAYGTGVDHFIDIGPYNYGMAVECSSDILEVYIGKGGTGEAAILSVRHGAGGSVLTQGARIESRDDNDTGGFALSCEFNQPNLYVTNFVGPDVDVWYTAKGTGKHRFYKHAAPTSVNQTAGHTEAAIHAASFNVANIKVVGAQGAAVADATDAASTMARLNDLLARVRAHGLIAT